MFSESLNLKEILNFWSVLGLKKSLNFQLEDWKQRILCQIGPTDLGVIILEYLGAYFMFFAYLSRSPAR